MFIFAQESGVSDDESYEFVPYNWGPCSFEIYEDMDSLIDDGLVERFPTGRGLGMDTLTRGEGERLDSASPPRRTL